MNIRHLLVFAILAFPFYMSGQSPSNNTRPLKVGMSMSGSMYIGDLTDDETMFHRIYPGANISLQSEGYRNLRGQLNAGFGRFSEQYDNTPPELPKGIFPVNFVETSFFYGDLRLKYRLFKRRSIQPFMSAGAGFLIFTPQDENGKFLSDAILTRPEGEFYNTAVPQLPVSFGVQARITPLMWLGAEYTYRYVPTDYLDNIGQLGRRPGNDQLHQVMVSLYFNLAEPGRDFFLPEEDDELPEIADAQEDKILPPPPPEKINRNAITLIPLITHKSVQPDLRRLAGAPSKIPLRPSLDSKAIDSLLNANIWETLAWEAWLEGKVFYYRPKEGDSYESLEERFEVKPEIIMEINQTEGEALSTQKELMIPDLRAWLKDDMAGDGIIELKNSEQVQQEEEAIRARRYTYYHVKTGDSLESVAARFQVRPSTIKKLNSLIDNHIYVDSYLRLPDLN
jgi:LysM repeat protein